jgi:NAD(P)-dependent dehydrogenase (short-subunit alcohol dehydrogenase family)
MKELRFDGRTAIVTGGGRGVGRGHALLLAARGARVVIADYGGNLEGTSSASRGPADEVVQEIKAAGGQAVACYASVAEPAGAESIVKTALDTFGRLDIVINNAGISAPGLFEDLTLEHFRRMIDVHYLGTVYVLKAAWPHLMKARYGRIVNTCSEGFLGLHPKVTGYAGGKGAVFGLTRTLASEGPKHGILVNAVAPRANTRLATVEDVAEVYGVPVEKIAPIVEMMKPELIAPVAAFLAHESCTLNGEVLAVGGGQVQRMAIVETKGIASQALTPEVVAEQLDQLLDMKDAGLIVSTTEVHLKEI